MTEHGFAFEIMVGLTCALGSLLLSGLAYLFARAWRPIESVEDMKLRLSKQEDRLAAGGATFSEIKTSLKEMDSRIHRIEVDLARLIGGADRVTEKTGRYRIGDTEP